MLHIIYLATQIQNSGSLFPGWTMFNTLVSSVIIPAFIGFYASYTFLFPQFLKRKKHLQLLLVGVLICFGAALFQDLYLSIVPGPGIFNNQWNSAIGITIILTFIATVNGLIGLIIKGFISWYTDIKLKEDLNKKNYEMELALIKSKINPHFLFNTINNIDILIQKDATKASSYLNKLSDIIRFMLYETKAEKISIDKELTYIEKYIELQKIRTSNSNFVNYSIEGNTANLNIAPMIFIPFIENAFKHAEDNKTESAINIKISIEKEQIKFKCKNKYSANNHSDLDQSGLGNALMQKRLALLYPNKHTLEVTDINGNYEVKLTLL
jgi:LytS/YehU family sensor histidine kinase